MKVFTIGHSNHDFAKFVSFLKGSRIEIIVDVRSTPYSRYVPHFNKNRITAPLEDQGMEYLFMGDRLGGRADSGKGKPLTFHEISQRESFHAGIEELIKIAGEKRTAIMCSERDPNRCHRKHLVSRELKRRGVDVVHILSDSTTIADDGQSPPGLFK